MTNVTKSCIAGGLITIAMTTGAQASTVDLQYQGSNAFGDPAWKQSVNVYVDDVSKNYQAGLFRMEEVGTGDGVLAWCINIYTYLKSPETYAVGDFLAESVQINVDKLFTSAYEMVVNSETAAAFQMALWEIVTETEESDLDLYSGNFEVVRTGGAYDLAASYIDGLATAGTGGYELTFFDSARNQDLVGGIPAAVPVPAAGLMLIAGLGGLAGLRRRAKS